MRIAVCFKIMPDYSRLSEQDWVWDDTHFVDTGFVRHIFNCYDESALEMALALSDRLSDRTGKQPKTTDLTALTVDDLRSELFLRHLLATGFHHAVRIECSTDIDLRFNPSATAALIAAYIRRNGQQLVLCGLQGGGGNDGQTGALLAEHLGWPCIREVTRVISTDHPDRITVFSRIDNAALVQTVRLPLVLTIGQSLDAPFLRFPSLGQKLAAKKQSVTRLSNTDLGIDDARLAKTDKTLTTLARPRKTQTCIFLKDTDPQTQARHLYDHYLKDRLTS